MPRPVIAGHLALAVAGLGLWIGFVATGAAALAWMAVGVILSVAGLGMATLVGGLPEPAANSAQPVAVGGAGSYGLPTEPGTGAPALAGRPVITIVIHGVLAASTILLVVLAAAGAG